MTHTRLLSRATVGVAMGLLASAPASAQPGLPPAAPSAARSPLFLVARADSVYIVIDSIAPRGHGWRVTRADGRVVADGLEPERSADRVTERLGPDLPLARRLTRADDAVTLVRRLLSDRAVSYTGLLLSRHIAAVTGRLAVDGAPGRDVGTSYRAELVRRADGVVRASFSATLRRAPSAALPVTALEAVPALEGMQLRWRYPRYAGDATDVVVGFLIERAVVGGDTTWRPLIADPVVRDDARTPGWLDSDVTDGASYRYRVVPVFIGGLAGEAGPVVQATMRDRLPPLAPLDVAADVQDGRVRIVWAMSPDADVDGYQVERRKGGSDSTWTRLTTTRVPAAVPEFVDATVRGGSIYAWRVRAVDRSGNAGPWATPVTTRAEERTPPEAPRNLTATLGAGRRATYRWEAPPAHDVAGYHVYRAAPGGTSVRLTGTPVPATSFVDSAAAGAGLLPGKTYRIEIVSVDSSANTSPPAFVMLTVPDDEPPAPPRLVRAQGRFGGSVTVTWTASPSLDVGAYVVDVTEPGGKAMRTIGQTGARGPLMLVDTAAADGVPLRYAVFAVDSAGNRSAPATDSLTKRDEERPSAPRAVAAVRSGSTVQLRWERVMSRDLAGYLVFRASSLYGRLEEIGRVAPGVHTFTDAAAPASAYYTVRAIDTSGNQSVPQGLVTPVAGAR
ncbi:MAG: hypothetical protein K2R93_09975 [Gemmatimonadaceae bacterium]|nr:hypothetical protein [Gemmatimonadaceae bacterium]